MAVDNEVENYQNLLLVHHNLDQLDVELQLKIISSTSVIEKKKNDHVNKLI